MKLYLLIIIINSSTGTCQSMIKKFINMVILPWPFYGHLIHKDEKNMKHSYSLQWQISIMSITYMQQEWSW